MASTKAPFDLLHFTIWLLGTIVLSAVLMSSTFLVALYSFAAAPPPPVQTLRPPITDWVYIMEQTYGSTQVSAQRNLSGPPLADTLRQHPDCPAIPPTQAPAAPESYDPRLWNRDPLERI